MDRLILLGDSVIDNGPYVAQGEPDVAAQVRERLGGWTVEMRAVDGNRTAEVVADIDASPLAPDVPRVLSVGGNDALGHMNLLSALWPTRFASALAKIRDIREAFRVTYRDVLSRIEGPPVMVLTIYNPRFTGREAAFQAAGEGGLSAFNDVIQQEALARGMAILDLRRLFSDAADYANPIEPSAIGGAKIADAVAAWCRTL